MSQFKRRDDDFKKDDAKKREGDIKFLPRPISEEKKTEVISSAFSLSKQIDGSEQQQSKETVVSGDVSRLQDPIEKKGSYEVSYEILNGVLHVNRLEVNGKMKMQRDMYELGKKFRTIRSESGSVLYWADRVYYTDVHANVFEISLPPIFDAPLSSYLVLENVFQKNGTFVVYKSPQQHTDDGICFFYDTSMQVAMTVVASKDFHNAIISNVQDVHFYSKGIIKGYVVVELSNVTQQFALKNIITESPNTYEAIIGDVSNFGTGDIGISHTGTLQYIPTTAEGIHGISGNFTYVSNDKSIVVTDTEREVSYTCHIPPMLRVQKVLLDEIGNIFCLAHNVNDPTAMSLVTATIKHTYDDVFSASLPYIKVRGMEVATTAEKKRQLVFLGKEENKSWELVVFHFSGQMYNVYTIALKSSDVHGDIFITAEDDTYKITSLSHKGNPTVMVCTSYVVHKDAPKLQYNRDEEKKREDAKKWYEREILYKGLPSYQELVAENKKMEEFVALLKTFVAHFSVGTKKTLMGERKESMLFDQKETIRLYKEILDNSEYKAD